MEFLKIEDVLTVANDFLVDPENEEKNTKLRELKENIVVKQHLSIFERGNIILRTLMDISTFEEEGSIEEIANALEISLTFNCLLAYTNIDPQINSVFKTMATYDIIWESGIADMILSYCERDYNRIEKQVYQTISYQNLMDLMRGIDQLQVGNIEELSESFKNFKKEADPEIIKNLAKIASFNDPIMKELEENIVQGAYKNLK